MDPMQQTDLAGLSADLFIENTAAEGCLFFSGQNHIKYSRGWGEQYAWQQPDLSTAFKVAREENK